jgi:hypothetical protein
MHAKSKAAGRLQKRPARGQVMAYSTLAGLRRTARVHFNLAYGGVYGRRRMERRIGGVRTTPIDTAEILHQFERATGKFARAAVEAAVAQCEEITPELLRILEDTVDRAAQLAGEGDYMAHLYAMFLLSQFRETRAYPLVVRFASLPGDQWVRGATLSSLATLVATGQKSRDEIVNYFAGLFRGKLVRKWSPVWDTLVSDTCDLYPAELLDDIERAYEEGLVDPGFIDFQDVKRNSAMGKDRILARLADDPHRRLVEDTVAEMAGGHAFGTIVRTA